MDGGGMDSRQDGRQDGAGGGAQALTLTETRLRAGVWEALVGTGADAAPDPPRIEVMHDGTALPGVTLTAVPGHPGAFALRVPVPATALSDGLQGFVVRDAAGGTTLAQFVIAAGDVMVDDLRAEVVLLRAELDLLKRAFRRHCLETAHP
jgi:hypothetical protein